MTEIGKKISKLHARALMGIKKPFCIVSIVNIIAILVVLYESKRATAKDIQTKYLSIFYLQVS